MEGSCPICLNALIEEKINILLCGHKICEDCIEKYIQFNNKCPICNETFNNYISKKDNKQHQLTINNLNNIDKNKRESQLNENFDCIPLEDINQQIQYLKSKANNLYNRLFGPRNENGSEKENDVLSNIFNNIEKIKEMMNEEEINYKLINEMIDKMIVEIKKIEKREYKDYIETTDEGLPFQIEYCTKKKGKKKKHK